MTCKDFSELNPLERIDLIGSLVHLVQTDADICRFAQEMVHLAKEAGKFERVLINPPQQPLEAYL